MNTFSNDIETYIFSNIVAGPFIVFLLNDEEQLYSIINRVLL